MVIYNFILLLILIFICLFHIFSYKFLKNGIFNLPTKNEEFRIIINKNKNRKFVTIKDVEAERIFVAEIIKENSINYTPKISLIIPVNIEDYLSKCLDSVINQTLKEIEIICIDDGSKDNTINILKNYAKKDKRITILKLENMNIGFARNAGLSVARGKYLSFLCSEDFLEFNMLEKMFEEIEKKQSDIIICNYKILYLAKGYMDEDILNNRNKLDLIPQKNPFSAFEISKEIFQLIEGWTEDKLFRTEFILSNNIRFQNIIDFNDHQFTFIALCLAKSITRIKEILVIKRHEYKKSLYSNECESQPCFLLSFDNIISNLEKKGLYNLVKESFWKWAFNICIFQLKNIDKSLKEYLYNILHDKLIIWNNIEYYPTSSNRYKALHFLKFQKTFPTINIAYAFNRKNKNLILLSLFSLLKNAEYESINIILISNDITEFELQQINELKEIYPFTMQIIYASDELFIDFPLTDGKSKELWYKYILPDKLSDLDKILYLDCKTIIRKSLLPLWEINMNNQIIAAVEDISFSKDKAKKANLKDNYYFNAGVILINAKEWRKLGLFKKAVILIKKDRNIFDPESTILNILTDMKKTALNPEFNYMEEYGTDDSCQYNNEYLKLYKEKTTTIFSYKYSKFNKKNSNSSFINDYLKYEFLLNNFKDIHLTIPIVLASDDKYALYMYTTMISILENKNKNTYYIFYLLVPFKFSKSNAKKILSIAENYNCYIHFINMDEKMFKYIKMHIRHITLTTFYRLLVGDLLPNEIDKCIYLDIDICVCKDLSELFNIDIKDNYLAGVVSPSYYFNEERICKRLNISSARNYLNAGMLIINLKQIRKNNMTQKFIELSKKNYYSQDQDVLNVACFGKIIALPPKYNAQVLSLKEINSSLIELYGEKAIIEAKNEPYIIHYSNKRKPWNALNIYMEEYWWAIAKLTPYANIFFNRDNIYIKELKKLWLLKYKKNLNLDNPKTFDEKLQWLKIYDSIPIKTLLCDQYLVRDWIAEKIGEEYLIPLLGTYDSFTEINFEKLPNSFVIKCNHGKGYNIIVKEKSQLNLTKAKIKVEKWMNENYAFHSTLDLQYRDIKHKILIEKFMKDRSHDLRNYQLFCFNGIPKLILIETSQNIYRMINFLKNNNSLYKNNTDYYIYPGGEKYKCLEKMIKLASILSARLIFVRVDFFMIKDKIYFNKISFTTSNRIEKVIPKNLYRKLSLLIKLPKLSYNIDTGDYYYELNKYFSLFPCIIILICFICKLLYYLYLQFH